MSLGWHPARRLAAALLLAGLGVALSPLFIPIGPTKAYPAQHMVNVVAGVLLGPLWAAGVAVLVGIARMSLGLGTIYSIPGGVPGAVTVGVAAVLLRRAGARVSYAAFAEPPATAGLGFALAYAVFAPLMGDQEKWALAMAAIWLGWLASTLAGTLIGYTVLRVLERLYWGVGSGGVRGAGAGRDGDGED